MKKIAILLALASILSALPARGVQTEPLFGIAADAEKKTLSIVVKSSGCTGKGDFSFAMKGDVLTFKRIRRDDCKAMPQRHTIIYSVEELGIDSREPFRLGNPISYSERLF